MEQPARLFARQTVSCLLDKQFGSLIVEQYARWADTHQLSLFNNQAIILFVCRTHDMCTKQSHPSRLRQTEHMFINQIINELLVWQANPFSNTLRPTPVHLARIQELVSQTVFVVCLQASTLYTYQTEMINVFVSNKHVNSLWRRTQLHSCYCCRNAVAMPQKHKCCFQI